MNPEQVLSKQDMLSVMEHRLRQFAAERLSQEIEIKVAKDIKGDREDEALEEVIEAATGRWEYYNTAVESVQRMIDELGPVPRIDPSQNGLADLDQ